MSNKKLFLKSFKISSLFVFCALFGFLGAAKAYEGIREVAYGEYRSAIDYEDGKLKFFDFEINFK